MGKVGVSGKKGGDEGLAVVVNSAPVDADADAAQAQTRTHESSQPK